MTETMDQQMKLSATRADYNMQQNTKMMEQFIRAQDRRDLDPALMDIPTFTGQEPEKCLEWITRIRKRLQAVWAFFPARVDEQIRIGGPELPIISRHKYNRKTTWWRGFYKCLATYRQPPKR